MSIPAITGGPDYGKLFAVFDLVIRWLYGSWIASAAVFRDLITLVSELQERGIHFRSLTDSIDTSTPAGRFFFHVMSALAEMERELIVERTRAGLAAAREQGRVGGRRRVMTEEVVARCRRMLDTGATRQQVADVIGVNVKTLYKHLPSKGTI
ncbi:DNA-invertase hin [Klebsiella pneumoniae]|uniref:DNA-invertase hin n=3 Tax=Klebsiella pneumoniae TaxID=573 RepID=A0A377XSS1_KLEPN|nr:DNA-invertase hin [Klebsiella pneumoniae]